MYMSTSASYLSTTVYSSKEHTATYSLSSTSTTSPLWLNSNLKRQVVAGIELAICSLLVNFPPVVAVASLTFPFPPSPLLPLVQLFCFPSISPNVYIVQQQLSMGIYRHSHIPHREWVSLYSWMVSECERRGAELKIISRCDLLLSKIIFPTFLLIAVKSFEYWILKKFWLVPISIHLGIFVLLVLKIVVKKY